MNDDYDPARITDPDTSKEAAAGLNVADMELAVLKVVARAGSNGRTWWEAEHNCNLPRQTISPRWAPLCKKGMLEKRFDAKGKPFTRLGGYKKQQTVWFITPLGLSMIRWRAMGL